MVHPVLLHSGTACTVRLFFTVLVLALTHSQSCVITIITTAAIPTVTAADSGDQSSEQQANTAIDAISDHTGKHDVASETVAELGDKADKKLGSMADELTAAASSEAEAVPGQDSMLDDAATAVEEAQSLTDGAADTLNGSAAMAHKKAEHGGADLVTGIGLEEAGAINSSGTLSPQACGTSKSTTGDVSSVSSTGVSSSSSSGSDTAACDNTQGTYGFNSSSVATGNDLAVAAEQECRHGSSAAAHTSLEEHHETADELKEAATGLQEGLLDGTGVGKEAPGNAEKSTVAAAGEAVPPKQTQLLKSEAIEPVDIHVPEEAMSAAAAVPGELAGRTEMATEQPATTNGEAAEGQTEAQRAAERKHCNVSAATTVAASAQQLSVGGLKEACDSAAQAGAAAQDGVVGALQRTAEGVLRGGEQKCVDNAPESSSTD
jgi:hypothetical protein